MEWLIIPGIVATLLVIFLIWNRLGKPDSDEITFFGCLILGILLLISLIACPGSYYSTRTSALSAEAYFAQVVYPNVVEEHEDYVIVKNLEQGIWQAGTYTLATYNNYLITSRYWNNVPVIGSAVYRPPEYLKYARVK